MDIGLFPTVDGWDIRFKNNDLEQDASLRTSVILSLIINKRALPEEVDGNNDLRGWWADPNVGSKLWLFEEGEIIQANTLIRIENEIRDALQWMVDARIAEDPIEIEAYRNSVNSVGVSIVIRRPNMPTERYRFDELWREINGILDFGTRTDEDGVPANAILINGVPLTVNGAIVTVTPSNTA